MQRQFKYQCCGTVVNEYVNNETQCRFCGKPSPILEEVDKDEAVVLFPPRAGHSWRVNFSRVEWDFDRYKDGYLRKDGPPCDNWVWSPQGVINMHIPEMWGHVIFSDVVVGTKEM